MIPINRFLRAGTASAVITAVLLLHPAVYTSAAATSDSKALELARELDRAFTDVSAAASQFVVVIKVTIRPEVSDLGSGSNPWLDKLPDWFKKEFMPDEDNSDDSAPSPRRGPGRRPPETFGQGSGVIIREDGYVLTNAHVVKDAKTIKVQLKDGREFDAEVRGIDELSEVAVVKLKGDGIKGLPAAKFADSDKVRVGQFAIAIGTPFALDYSVTIGHVSAKGRGNIVPDYMNGDTMDQDFIQTDANINPGNSGGPLVDLDGEVIGINTMIRGIGTGIGFAVPSNIARMVSAKLIEKGSYERAWLGVKISELRDNPDRDILAPGYQDGLVVFSIPAGGPASKSDLKPSDVIVAVNDKKVATTRELRSVVRSYPLGTTLTLDVVRGGKDLKIDVETGNLPETTLAEIHPGFREVKPAPEPMPLGIKVESITPALAKQYGIAAETGVVITKVDESGPAAICGLRPGMVITDVNHHAVKSLENYQQLLSGADLKKGVLLNLVDPDGNSQFQVLKDE